VVSVIFAPYEGPAGDAQAKQAELAAMAAQQLSQVQGAQATSTALTGVGDAALFITDTVASPPLRLAALIVLDGPMVLECGNYNVGSASFASQQTALTQVCQLVVNRLDP
jgi:hypothetical protein